MILLARVWTQLDNWRAPIEHLATAIQYEVIVGRHKREGNRLRIPVPVDDKAIPFPPCLSELSVIASQLLSAPEEFFVRPQELVNYRCRLIRDRLKPLVVREQCP